MILCGRRCTNGGGLFSPLKSALPWPVARSRIAFWQFYLFIILSNTPNYPIKAVSLPLTCFFPCISIKIFFFLSLNTWVTASKGQLNIFRYAEISLGDFFLIGCYGLRALQILMQWRLNEVSMHVEPGCGFNVLSLSILFVKHTQNISGNFQGARYTSFLVVKIADSLLWYCE